MGDVTNNGFGDYASAKQQTDPGNHASRISLRPAEFGKYGSYSQAFNSGVMAAGLAAGSVIFAWQWLQKGLLCIPKRGRLTAGTDATAFAQGSTIFDILRAQSITAQYTGGATLNLLGKSGALGTRFAPSLQNVNNSAVGSVAVASTATLVAGTPAPTFDNNAMGILVGSVGAVPLVYPVQQPGYLIDPSEAGRQPLELQVNEGFVIRATVPITGTWKFGVEVGWDEVDP